MNIEEIFDSVGGFGPFQLAVTFLIYGTRLVMSWSMMMMSFVGVAPDWWCSPSDSLNTSFKDNTTFEKCSIDNTSCTFAYSDDMTTIINKWDLICDKEKIPATITSIQMAGVMVGAFAGGQSSDVIGRKKTHFFSLTLHGISNIIAAFSVSWEMFAAVRFFVGFGIGAYLAVSYTYVIESYGVKWRSLLSMFPLWMAGVGIFALSAWLRPNWSDQHIIVGALHIPFILGWFIVPESLRWLTVQGRIEEAEKVVDQMSRYNRKKKPDNTAEILKLVAEEERIRRESGRKYTYIDVYRGGSMCRKSIILQFMWTCISLVFYGISFGVGSLSGNLFFNIFLLGIIEIPGMLTLAYLTNRIGRRWTTVMYLLLSAVSAFSIAVVSVYVPKSSQGASIIVLAMICKLGIGSGWGVIGIITSESYPTVIRNLGSGAANTTSRIGGILAPFVFAMTKDVFIPFIIVGSATTICAILTMMLEETMGQPLQDTLEVKEDNSKKSRISDTSAKVPYVNGLNKPSPSKCETTTM